MAGFRLVDGQNTQDFDRLRRDAVLSKGTWHGTAFIVEAMILLVVLVASIAIVLQVFATSDRLGKESSELSDAVVMATNLAERFAASPASMNGVVESDGDLRAECTVLTDGKADGTLYTAFIEVYDTSEGVLEPASRNYETPLGTGMGVSSLQSSEAEGKEMTKVYELETSRYMSDRTVAAPAASEAATSEDASQVEGEDSSQTAATPEGEVTSDGE